MAYSDSHNPELCTVICTSATSLLLSYVITDYILLPSMQTYYHHYCAMVYMTNSRWL